MITVTPNIIDVEIVNGAAVVTVTPTPVNVTVEKGNVTITGTTTNMVVGETPSGLVNGSNTAFVTAFSFIPESVEIFMSGVRLSIIADYQTSGTTNISLISAPLTGELIRVNYLKV